MYAIKLKPNQTLRMWKEQKGKCIYCDHDMILGDKWRMPTLEHILPRSKGGSDHIDNLCFACCKCNMYRGNLDIEVFLDGYRQGFIHSKGDDDSTPVANKVRGPKRWYHGKWIVW